MQTAARYVAAIRLSTSQVCQAWFFAADNFCGIWWL